MINYTLKKIYPEKRSGTLSLAGKYSHYGSCYIWPDACRRGSLPFKCNRLCRWHYFQFCYECEVHFLNDIEPLRFIKFVSTCAFCYILNLIAMKVFFIVIPNAIYTAQVVGMVIYTTAGFILNKYWSMK